LVSIEEVAANSHADAPWFSFTWAHGANKLSESDFSSVWDLMGQDKEHGIVAANMFTNGAMSC